MEKSRRSPTVEAIRTQEAKYKALNTVEFMTDQIREINLATEYVWIQTMAFEAGHFSDLLTHSLVQASQRGVDVRFVCDAYSDYVTANSFNHLRWFMSNENRQHQYFLLERKSALLIGLEKACKTKRTNYPEFLLSQTPLPGFLGRDHKKISLIDGKVYIGGSNLTPLDSTRADIMIKTDNKHIVEGAKRIFLNSFIDKPAKDFILRCDSNNRLLIDEGKMGRSLIMEEACNVVNSAQEKIILVSPYIPMQRLRNALNNASSRGVSVEIVTSNETQLGFAPKLSQLVHNFGQSEPEFSILRCPETVHAKILTVDNTIAMVGSHNFDELFVYFGTEEIVLVSEEQALIQELNEYIEKLKSGRLYPRYEP
ncbi:MAG: phosphatidylserine/phosphatidylglycerophosphate/cardiolipin synthase family protein [Microgenomates group bacterium]